MGSDSEKPGVPPARRWAGMGWGTRGAPATTLLGPRTLKKKFPSLRGAPAEGSKGRTIEQD